MSPREQLIAFMTILRKEIKRYLRIWTQTLLPSAITMSLYFVIFGTLIGSRIGELGGFTYIKDPPSVTFWLHGKLLTVHGNKIAVNALKDEVEASKIIEWMKREINNVWDKHDNITPRYEGLPRPQVIQILKCLPKTNCRECGEPTCMVFATRVAEGVKGSDQCPTLTPDGKMALNEYMTDFNIKDGNAPW